MLIVRLRLSGGGSVGENMCDEAASEKEKCPCERITLTYEDWSSCLLQDHLRQCGQGQQQRRRKCVITATSQLAPIPYVSIYHSCSRLACNT